MLAISRDYEYVLVITTTIIIFSLIAHNRFSLVHHAVVSIRTVRHPAGLRYIISQSSA